MSLARRSWILLSVNKQCSRLLLLVAHWRVLCPHPRDLLLRANSLVVSNGTLEGREDSVETGSQRHL